MIRSKSTLNEYSSKRYTSTDIEALEEANNVSQSIGNIAF